MRAHATRCAVVAVVVACAVFGASAVSVSTNPDGRLAGLTQISYGCPGPQRVGQQCERWSMFAHARFALMRNRADGTPVPSTRRIVASDGSGRFSLALPAGSYTIIPLPQTHTRGGATLTARIRPGQTTRITIRFGSSPVTNPRLCRRAPIRTTPAQWVAEGPCEAEVEHPRQYVRRLRPRPRSARVSDQGQFRCVGGPSISG
jgi:hypothetical protein